MSNVAVNTLEFGQTADQVVIRFAGDSGDGMQLVGSRFTEDSAFFGNDLATQSDFPAEIRAPAGSVAGVSGFQIQFGSREIFTPGDELDVLVAMNPAALRKNLNDLKPNGILICNSDGFTEKNLQKANFESSPLESEELKIKFQLIPAAITSLTLEALKQSEISTSSKQKCKNFFALGIVSWLFQRTPERTLAWIESKFKSSPEVIKANHLALEAGMAFAQASELFKASVEVKPAALATGKYRNITGNLGLAYGLIAASRVNKLPLFYSGYPITPASEVLHEISRHKNQGAVTFQAEDEIAAACAALGASYAGSLAVTASSGPGILLKQEAINLALTAELPMVIVNIQRAGPSTGMPTSNEQADLLSSLYGRNGESPIPIVAISSPANAFDATYEACRIAIEYMTPVFLMSDGNIGNGSEPWLIPEIDKLKAFKVFRGPESNFQPYMRNPDTLARPWVVPGVGGKEHRIGGLEKEDISGNISYDPLNHEKMVELRAKKVVGINSTIAPIQVNGDPQAELVLLAWGSTLGAVSSAVQRAQKEGISVSSIHLRQLNPLPADLKEKLSNFKKVLIPELNSGQLLSLIKSKYLLNPIGINKVQGKPFRTIEILEAIRKHAGA